MKKITPSIVLLFLSQLLLFSQNHQLVDSLETLLKSATQDTTKSKVLLQLCYAFIDINPDTAIIFANQSLSLSDRIGFRKGSANAFISLGEINENKGNFKQAMELHMKALKVMEEIGNKKGISRTLTYIGMVFQDQCNYPEALKNLYAALKIDEELGDRQSCATALGNIGAIYFHQGNILIPQHKDRLPVFRKHLSMLMLYNNIL